MAETDDGVFRVGKERGLEFRVYPQPNAVGARLLDSDSNDTGVDLDVELLTEADAEGNTVYSVSWTPTVPGVFVVEFTADTAVTTETVHVLEPRGVEPLPDDYEIVFTSLVEPLLLDPEEFTAYYTEAGQVEILEFIHRYSVEIESYFGKGNEPPLIAYEYIRAAVLCSLGKIYGHGLDGDASSLTLGDLTISRQSYPRNQITRANAANWCELAAVLRAEMLRAASGMRGVVKGVAHTNPIPRRKVRNQARRSHSRGYRDEY